MKIHMFDTDTGNRDLGREKRYCHDIEEYVIIQEAKRYAEENQSNCVIVVKTSSYGTRPGAWYIKGYTGQFSYEDLYNKLQLNEKNGKYKQRRSWLIRI